MLLDQISVVITLVTVFAVTSVYLKKKGKKKKLWFVMSSPSFLINTIKTN